MVHLMLLNTQSPEEPSHYWCLESSTLLPSLLEEFFVDGLVHLAWFKYVFKLIINNLLRFQDFLSYLPAKKQKISSSTASSLSDIKWAVVAFSVLTSVLVGFRRNSNPSATLDMSTAVSLHSTHLTR